MQYTHKRIHKIGIVLGILLIAISLLTGCKKEEVQEADTEKTIIIGYDKFEPYTYLDINGEMTGIDVEIAKEALGELGYQPVFKFISWEEKDNLLADGTIDCLWSCFTMTGREENYNWAGPYLYSRQVVAVQSDSDIYTLEDLKGKDVAVQVTTKAETVFLNPTEYNLPEVNSLVSLSTTEEMFAMLRKGYVDAIAGHGALIDEFANGSDAYRTLDESLFISELGVAFEKGTHEELVQQLTEVLETMKQDGRMATIVKKYGLDPEKVIYGESENEK